jgi:hypothetical protein
MAGAELFMPRFAVINNSIVENIILSESKPVINDRIIIGPLRATDLASPGDTWNGSVFIRRITSTIEDTHIAAPDKLVMAYPALRQWAIDAQNTYDVATSANRALSPAEQREFLRRVGILMNRLADLLAVQNLDS